MIFFKAGAVHVFNNAEITTLNKAGKHSIGEPSGNTQIDILDITPDGATISVDTSWEYTGRDYKDPTLERLLELADKLNTTSTQNRPERGITINKINSLISGDLKDKYGQHSDPHVRSKLKSIETSVDQGDFKSLPLHVAHIYHHLYYPIEVIKEGTIREQAGLAPAPAAPAA